MKQLIIAEKPHLERLVCSFINEQFKPYQVKNSNTYNYYESENYIVTHAYGHLFEAYSIEDYTKEPVEWKLDNLPFFPPNDHFYFKLKQKKDKATNTMITDPDIKLQFECILYLVNRDDVNAIIHCGDADREGEVIVRQIIKNTNKSNKPVLRLWFSEETFDAFSKSFRNMKPDSDYDNYAAEGFTRLKEDWLYGINLTRYLTLKSQAPHGIFFRVGRVLCGMLFEIYNRDKEIATFVPVPYYALVSDIETNGEKIHLRYKDTYSKEQHNEAKKKAFALNEAGARVTNITKEEKIINPGKLHSLTSLQNILKKKYNINITEADKYIQSVYEKGFITYPRTNTQYLGTTEKENVLKRIEVFNKLGYKLKFRDSKTIFDDSKVTSHSALCPTYKIPKENELSLNEQKVYDCVKNRFLAVFCEEPCLIDKSTMYIDCLDETFKITGSVLKQKGFLEYDEKETKDTFLPNLNIGDIVKVSFNVTEEKTKPPSHYTQETFSHFLQFPFATETASEDDLYKQLVKGIEIGTVATRTTIISNMISNGYIILHNDSYLIQPTGIYVVETLKDLGIDMSKEKTVEMSVTLKKVNDGTISEKDAMALSKKDLTEMFALRNKEVMGCVEAGVVNSSGIFNAVSIGKCPICDGNVYDTPHGFKCENNTNAKDADSCPFIIFKNDRYISAVTGKKITEVNAKSVINKGFFIGKTKDKKNNEYEVILKMQFKEDGSVGWKTEYEIGTCPICGGKVNITPFGYKCQNNNEKKDCYFILFRNDKFINTVLHKPLSLNNVLSLLKNNYFRASVEKKDKSGKYPLNILLKMDHINKKIQWESQYIKKK